jgi:hypothetical protein
VRCCITNQTATNSARNSYKVFEARETGLNGSRNKVHEFCSSTNTHTLTVYFNTTERWR